MLAGLKRFNWRQHSGTAFKVVMDFKVAGLFCLNGLLLYGIAWDTLLRPSLETLSAKQKTLEVQRKERDEKETLYRQYDVWERQLKTMDAEMIPVPPNRSLKVASIAEAAEVLALAQGKKRNTNVLPALQPPYNQREQITLSPTGDFQIDLRQPDAIPTGASASPPPVQPPAAGPAAPAGEQGPPLPIDRFDYDLKVTGTYPALIDLLNELVIRHKLLRINQVIISKNQADAALQPAASEYPDFPLKLDMVVSLSMFMYASDASPAAP